MSEPTNPPSEPLLIPDSPIKRKQRRNLQPAPPIAPPAEISTFKNEDKSPPPGSPEPPPKRELKTYTLEEAFDFFCGDPYDTDFQNERCVRSITYLLHYCSEFGNKDVDGWAAHGFACVLESCAARMTIASRARARMQEQLNSLGAH